MQNILMRVLLGLLITGCGGGGGSGDSAPSFGGVYRAALILTDNSCGPGFDGVVTVTQTVNQDGETIVMDSGDSVLTGTVNAGRNGFSVSRETESESCTIEQAIAYTEDSSGESDFVVALIQRANCTGLVCSLTYLGVANQT